MSASPTASFTFDAAPPRHVSSFQHAPPPIMKTRSGAPGVLEGLTDTPLADPFPQTTSFIGTYVHVPAGALIVAPPAYGFGGPASGAPASAEGAEGAFVLGGAGAVVVPAGDAAGLVPSAPAAEGSAEGSFAVPQAFAPARRTTKEARRAGRRRGVMALEQKL